MYIVHSIGSDEEHPFKVFSERDDAVAGAVEIAKSDVERVFIYEWTGDLHDGLAAARKGQLEPMMHYPHREAPRVPPPEKALHLSEQSKKLVSELVKKMPKIARKF